MTRILLIGKNGQVGYELERSLQSLGDVTALDRAQLDLSDADRIREVVRTLKPELIVNAAAYTAVDKAESEPDLAFRINATAPGVMADEAEKIGAGIVHFSTDYVFNGAKASPYTEEDLPDPINVYGRSKLAGEQAVQASGAAHLILRTSWVYGMRGKNFLQTILRLAAEKDELRIVADQFGAPTWSRTIADTAANILGQLRTEKGAFAGLEQASGIYHLSAQGRTNWYEFTNAIVANAALAKMPRITAIGSDEYPTPARRPMNSVLSCDKLTQRFCALPAWDLALRLCQQ
ncbi:MAG: dTDP-4-dehydrorhamnose reductase [Herbaspirillum sp.]|nr:dTDP-4-dehydrorhamnose reductase [Herbaspirillum sp.]